MSEQKWRILARLYLLGVLGLLGATFLHYGLTWDEELHRLYGECILKWYGSFFKDASAVNFETLHFYGGFFDSVAAWASQILPLGVYESRHFVNTLFGFLAIVYSYRLGKHLAGEAGGFFSALFLTLTPVFYGHIFNNPKDIPFAALFTAALYYLIVFYDDLPRLTLKSVLKLGTVIGLMLGVRVGGIFIFGFAALLWAAWTLIRMGSGGKGWGDCIKSLVVSGAGILAVGWCVMLVFWPWAQTSPLQNPWRAFGTFSKFDWPLPVLYYGRYISAKQLPWDYFSAWFFISLPEFYFLALLAGCFLGLRFFGGRRQGLLFEGREVKVIFLAAVVLSPVLAVMILRPTIYDGLRQFLFLIPPLAVLAGVSFTQLIHASLSARFKIILSVLVFISALLTVWDMVRLHPYENVYFNRLVGGGMKRGANNFETDYWGNSYKEGAEWLMCNYPSLYPDARKIRVANSSRPFLTGYFLEKREADREHFQTVNPNEHPDIFMAVTRWNGHEAYPGRVLHTVERCGVPLLYIIRPEAKQSVVAAFPESGYNKS